MIFSFSNFLNFLHPLRFKIAQKCGIYTNWTQLIPRKFWVGYGIIEK